MSEFPALSSTEEEMDIFFLSEKKKTFRFAVYTETIKNLEKLLNEYSLMGMESNSYIIDIPMFFLFFLFFCVF